MKISNKRRLYFAFFSIIVFLANPFYELYDVLPDFIAYVILFFILADFSRIYPHFDNARREFQKLIWISISKLPFSMLLRYVSSKQQNEITLTAVIMLMYTIVELLFIIPAVSSLVKGFRYINEREDAGDVIGGNKLTLGCVHVITVLFFIARSVFSLIPELLLVPVSERDGLYLSKYHSGFLTVFTAIMLFLALIWIFIISKYALSLFKSEKLADALSRRICEQGDKLQKKRFIYQLTVFFDLTAIAVGFAIDLVFDSVNILPDVISAMLFLFACMVAKKFISSKEFYVLFTCGLLYIILSVLSYCFNIAFFDKFTYDAIAKTDKAATEYTYLVIMSAFENIAFIIYMYPFTRTICKIACDHTGYEYNEKATDTIHQKIKNRCIFFYAVSVLLAVASFMYTYLKSFPEVLPADSAYVTSGKVIAPVFGGFWIVPIIISIFFTIYTLNFFSYVKEEINDKYEEI